MIEFDLPLVEDDVTARELHEAIKDLISNGCSRSPRPDSDAPTPRRRGRPRIAPFSNGTESIPTRRLELGSGVACNARWAGTFRWRRREPEART